MKSGQSISILDWLSEHAGVEIYLIFESHQMSSSTRTVRPEILAQYQKIRRDPLEQHEHLTLGKRAARAAFDTPK